MGLGIVRSSGPIRAAARCRHSQCSKGAFPFAHHGRREYWPHLVSRNELHGLGSEFGCEVDQVINRRALAVVSWRFGRVRLRGRIPLARHITFFHRPLGNRPDGLTIRPIENVEERLLGGLCKRFDGAAIDRDVHEHGRAGNIVVPDSVVHQLEMPLALPGFQIQRDDGLAEQTVARPMPSIVVACGQLYRQVHHSQFFVHADLAPHTGIAGILGGAVLPRLISILARQRNSVKDPEALARPDVEPADVTLHVLFALRNSARPVRGADHDGIASHDRRCMQSDFAGDRVDFLIVIELQVDGSVLAEARHRIAGLGIQSDEAVARRNVKDALFSAIAPIRQSTARQ